MTSADAGPQRMQHQHLTAPVRGGPLDVVRHLGAMQAQDYGQALWAIGSRLPDATVDDVTRAIADGLILRTWPMRGTIHFVPAVDARWMLTVSAARTAERHGTRLAQLGLDASTLERSSALLMAALDGAPPISRPQAMQLFEDAGISTAGQRGYTLLWHAAHDGLICFGPMQGKQQTFALLRDWAPAAEQLSRDAAVTELARRYFTSHGPATVHDFAWWSALTITESRTAVARLAAELVATSIAGIEHWSGSSARGRVAGGERLVAGFDEFLLGYKDRSAVLPADYADRIVPGNNGVFQPTMVCNGQIVGTWKRTIGAQSVSVELIPFEDISTVREGFIAEAERYARFVGVPLARVALADPIVQR